MQYTVQYPTEHLCVADNQKIAILQRDTRYTTVVKSSTKLLKMRGYR